MHSISTEDGQDRKPSNARGREIVYWRISRATKENQAAGFALGGRPRFFFALDSPVSPLAAPSTGAGLGFFGGLPLGRFGAGSSDSSGFFSYEFISIINVDPKV